MLVCGSVILLAWADSQPVLGAGAGKRGRLWDKGLAGLIVVPELKRCGQSTAAPTLAMPLLLPLFQTPLHLPPLL